MDMSRLYKRVSLVVMAIGCGSVASLAGAGAWAQTTPAPVAGLQPDRRPEGAPVVQSQTASPAVVAQRLKGISQPWPGNVRQIAEQQGNWYSPMFTPGMNPPYDIRDLHAGKP